VRLQLRTRHRLRQVLVEAQPLPAKKKESGAMALLRKMQLQWAASGGPAALGSIAMPASGSGSGSANLSTASNSQATSFKLAADAPTAAAPEAADSPKDAAADSPTVSAPAAADSPKDAAAGLPTAASPKAADSPIAEAEAEPPAPPLPSAAPAAAPSVAEAAGEEPRGFIDLGAIGLASPPQLGASPSASHLAQLRPVPEKLRCDSTSGSGRERSASDVDPKLAERLRRQAEKVHTGENAVEDILEEQRRKAALEGAAIAAG